MSALAQSVSGFEETCADEAPGLNVVVVGGIVGSINFDKTRRGDDACSFTVSIRRSGGTPTWVRVNVFGNFVRNCRARLRAGIRVEVTGEMMNRRQGEAMFTEIRCSHLGFLN